MLYIRVYIYVQEILYFQVNEPVFFYQRLPICRLYIDWFEHRLPKY